MVPMGLYWERLISIEDLFHGIRVRIFGELGDEFFEFILGHAVRDRLKESLCYTAASENSPACVSHRILCR